MFSYSTDRQASSLWEEGRLGRGGGSGQGKIQVAEFTFEIDKYTFNCEDNKFISLKCRHTSLN